VRPRCRAPRRSPSFRRAAPRRPTRRRGRLRALRSPCRERAERPSTTSPRGRPRRGEPRSLRLARRSARHESRTPASRRPKTTASATSGSRAARPHAWRPPDTTRSGAPAPRPLRQDERPRRQACAGRGRRLRHSAEAHPPFKCGGGQNSRREIALGRGRSAAGAGLCPAGGSQTQKPVHGTRAVPAPSTVEPPCSVARRGQYGGTRGSPV
jgi:hypothetical protein